MPVLPVGSSTDPTFAYVWKDTTGASCRSITRKVKPLRRVNLVTFFSKSFSDWAASKPGSRSRRKRTFICFKGIALKKVWPLLEESRSGGHLAFGRRLATRPTTNSAESQDHFP